MPNSNNASSYELHYPKPIESRLHQPKVAGSVIAGSAEAIIEASLCLMLEIREWEIQRFIECTIKDASEEEQEIEMDKKLLEQMSHKIVDTEANKIFEARPDLDDKIRKALLEELEKLRQDALKMTKEYLSKTRIITKNALAAFKKGDFKLLEEKMGKSDKSQPERFLIALKNLEEKSFFRQHPALVSALTQPDPEVNSLLPSPAGREITQIAKDLHREIKDLKLDFDETDTPKVMREALKARLTLRISHQLQQIEAAKLQILANTPSAPALDSIYVSTAPKMTPSIQQHSPTLLVEQAVHRGIYEDPVPNLPLAEASFLNSVDNDKLPVAEVSSLNSMDDANLPVAEKVFSPQPQFGTIVVPEEDDDLTWAYIGDLDTASNETDINDSDDFDFITQSNEAYLVLQAAQQTYVSAAHVSAQQCNEAIGAYYENEPVQQAVQQEAYRNHINPSPSPFQRK